MLSSNTLLWDVVLAVLLMVLYAVSMSVYVGLEDDGVFILASYFNGVAHPPGYPLYTLLGHLASQIEISTVAARLHALSAVLGVVACLFISRITHFITGSNYLGFISGLVYGLSETFWAQSIVAEVYTLNSAIFYAIFYLLLVFMGGQFKSNYEMDTQDSKRANTLLCLAGFLFGLGVSNHWPLLILSSPALGILVITRWRLVLKSLPLVTFFFILGLFPYVLMYFKGGDPEAWITFGGWNSVREFTFYVMREGYGNVDNSVTAGFSDKLGFALFSLTESSRQFGPIGCLVGFLGFVILLANKHQRILALSMLMAFLGSSVILSSLLGFDFDEYRKIVFSVYLLVPFGIISILIGVAIGKFISLTKSAKTRISIGLLVLCYPLLTFAKNIPNLYGKDDSWAHNYATWVLETLPENSTLFVLNDMDTGSVGYLHYIEGVRADLSVYQFIGAVYPNRLFHPYRTSKVNQKEIITNFVKRSETPFFSTSAMSIPVKGRSLGALYRYGSVDDADYQSYYLPKNQELVLSLLNRRPKNGWQIFHREVLSQQILYSMLNQQGLEKIPDDVLGILLETFDAKLYLLKWLLVQDEVNVAMAGRLVHNMEESTQKAYSKISLAEFYYVAGLFYIGSGDRELGISELERSIEIDPTKRNGAVDVLFEEYKEADDAEKLRKLKAKTRK